ncbi:hypothetical protein GQ44DRAFT_718636 [Phaeosphaeriaceae sp. PMI808]|nr:hypothetical protein GQ44DRAFT_718636 [Phaeosphaeriaceae sp. PMI808]
MDGWKDNKDPDDSEDDYDAVHDAVGSLIGTLQHTALENLAHQPTIVKLLQSIQRLPPQAVQTPSQETQNIVWSDMPQFTHYLTDMYEYQQHLFISSPSPSPDSVISKWASVNAWVARLVSTRIDTIGGVDYYIHRASCCFLRVLDVEGHPHFKDDIPATANLFRYASPVILRLCREEIVSLHPPIGIFYENSREISEGKKLLWTKLGYSMDRWAWWKTRWGQLAASSELEGLQGDVKDALAAMKAAEL